MKALRRIGNVLVSLFTIIAAWAVIGFVLCRTHDPRLTPWESAGERDVQAEQDREYFKTLQTPEARAIYEKDSAHEAQEAEWIESHQTNHVFSR